MFWFSMVISFCEDVKLITCIFCIYDCKTFLDFFYLFINWCMVCANHLASIILSRSNSGTSSHDSFACVARLITCCMIVSTSALVLCLLLLCMKSWHVRHTPMRSDPSFWCVLSHLMDWVLWCTSVYEFILCVLPCIAILMKQNSHGILCES